MKNITFSNVDRVIAGEADNLDDSNDIWWDRERGEVFNRYTNDRESLAHMSGGQGGLTNGEYFRICLHQTGVAVAQTLYMTGYH